MSRRLTPGQANFPKPDDFVAIASRWKTDAIDRLLRCVWLGFDALIEKQGFRVSSDQENVERSISYHAYLCIHDEMDAASPFRFIHLPPEEESLASSNAAPPTPDFAFALRENPRCMFPLEAKVLQTDGTVADYNAEILDNFISRRYGPFSSEGAMLGYLLSGSAATALKNISLKLGNVLAPHTSFRGRPHACSYHVRVIPEGLTLPANFTCHHMIIAFNRSANTPQASHE